MTGSGIETIVLQVTRQALLLTIMISGIPIAMSMLVGTMVSVMQAATQIQEQTLTFVPKLICVFGTLIVAGYWMIAQLVKFTQAMFALMPRLGVM